jgi:hypothetical protein
MKPISIILVIVFVFLIGFVFMSSPDDATELTQQEISDMERRHNIKDSCNKLYPEDIEKALQCYRTVMGINIPNYSNDISEPVSKPQELNPDKIDELLEFEKLVNVLGLGESKEEVWKLFQEKYSECQRNFVHSSLGAAEKYDEMANCVGESGSILEEYTESHYP